MVPTVQRGPHGLHHRCRETDYEMDSGVHPTRLVDGDTRSND